MITETIPESPPPATTIKEPWAMTQDEWNSATRFYRSGRSKNAQTPTGEHVILQDAATAKTHTVVSAVFYRRIRRNAVIVALHAGKPVPEHVLQDYPELNARTGEITSITTHVATAADITSPRERRIVANTDALAEDSKLPSPGDNTFIEHVAAPGRFASDGKMMFDLQVLSSDACTRLARRPRRAGEGRGQDLSKRVWDEAVDAADCAMLPCGFLNSQQATDRSDVFSELLIYFADPMNGGWWTASASKVRFIHHLLGDTITGWKCARTQNDTMGACGGASRAFPIVFYVDRLPGAIVIPVGRTDLNRIDGTRAIANLMRRHPDLNLLS